MCLVVVKESALAYGGVDAIAPAEAVGQPTEVELAHAHGSGQGTLKAVCLVTPAENRAKNLVELAIPPERSGSFGVIASLRRLISSELPKAKSETRSLHFGRQSTRSCPAPA